MSHHFTVKIPEKLRVLKTTAKISPWFDLVGPGPFLPYKEFEAIWDTGATNTAISQRVVDACGLKPIAMTVINTANGFRDSEIYLINLVLPNNVTFPQMKVTHADMGKTNVLIGMDVISQGDFAVTTKDGVTCFSYRYPSMVTIDFSKMS